MMVSWWPCSNSPDADGFSFHPRHLFISHVAFHLTDRQAGKCSDYYARRNEIRVRGPFVCTRVLPKSGIMCLRGGMPYTLSIYKYALSPRCLWEKAEVPGILAQNILICEQTIHCYTHILVLVLYIHIFCLINIYAVFSKNFLLYHISAHTSLFDQVKWTFHKVLNYFCPVYQ